MSENPTSNNDAVAPDDLACIGRQLGRMPRGVLAVAHRCPCGQPDVVMTSPRLDDGTPFPTLYYLTCPRASAAIGTLESSGLMRDLEDRLAEDEAFADSYRQAHEAYVREREGIEQVDEIGGVSAGGMPSRVKCLHVLVAHSLAAGPGVNLPGDIALEQLGSWWTAGPCARVDSV